MSNGRQKCGLSVSECLQYHGGFRDDWDYHNPPSTVEPLLPEHLHLQEDKKKLAEDVTTLASRLSRVIDVVNAQSMEKRIKEMLQSPHANKEKEADSKSAQKES